MTYFSCPYLLSRRDWAGLECEEDMGKSFFSVCPFHKKCSFILNEICFASAYCMVNHKEFFSEISVTYLADAYHELDLKDNGCMEECCPPLMAPTVVQRVRSKGCTAMRVYEESIRSDGSLLTPLIESERSLNEVTAKVRWPVANTVRVGVLRLLSRRDSDSMRAKVPHCNKFYPFTKGQLEKHDPKLSATFTDLWTQIAAWHDEANENACMRLIRNCWPK